jgi:16S rRNA (uracil1498-N3)-methyltransferase
MALKSVYLPLPLIENNKIRIAGEEHRHLTVARAERGELVEIFDGKGGVWTVKVESIQKREIVACVESVRHVPRPALDLILGQAMIRTSAFEMILEKAVEVGVTRIVPFTAARSNWSGGDRLERWGRIIVEAAKQSKRYHLPVLDGISMFQQTLDIPAASKILFAERGGGPLKSALSASPVFFLIGPEGGWTDAESSSAIRRGFSAVSLGSGILKAETAALVAAALIQYELGGM